VAAVTSTQKSACDLVNTTDLSCKMLPLLLLPLGEFFFLFSSLLSIALHLLQHRNVATAELLLSSCSGNRSLLSISIVAIVFAGDSAIISVSVTFLYRQSM
jgi:hypothetical protein